jgi:putative peptidoglycan lipid II flippase
VCSSDLLLSLLVMLGMWFSPDIVGVMAPDFGTVPGKLGLTTLMTRIMFPFLILVSLAALAMGVLNTKGKFFVPSLASSFFNLGSVVTGVGLSLAAPRFGMAPIVGMAWGTLVGGLLQLMVQVPLLWRVGFRLRFVLQLREPGLLRIVKLMLPAMVGLSATQINIFINTFYASSCAQGSVSWLNYAYRLFHLPMGLFGVALMVATLPVVSRHAANRNLAALRDALNSSLSLAILVTMPAACGLIFLAQPIIGLIYQHGQFTAVDTQQTAAALALYSLGLVAFAGVKIIVPVYYALDDTRIPVLGAFVTVAANLFILHFTLAALQHWAIALSTSLSMILNFIFLAAVLYRKLSGFKVRGLILTLFKVAGASVIMGLAVHWLHPHATAWLGAGLGGQALGLAGVIAIGMGLYVAMVSQMQIPEFQELVRHARSKLSH